MDFGLPGEWRSGSTFLAWRWKSESMANNRLSGAMPAFFYDSDAVEELSVGNNAFEGEVRCPPSPRPTFRVFDAERNALDGPLPDCFFESYPNLQRLRLGANALTGPLPWTVGDAKRLVTLDIPKAGLTGPLPPELAKATALASISLSHNYLDGTLDGSLLNAFPHLYLFDASYNAFTGPLPQVSCCIPHLRHLILSQNRFTGSVDEDTFLSFALHQTSAATSELSIAYNALSGRIPRIFKAFFYGADARLSAVDVTSNHFRCGRARSAYFEDWAHFMNYDVGMCAPVPRPRAVVGARFYPGAMIDVEGANFLATEEAKCLFLDAASGAAWVSPAAYRSRTTLSCALAYSSSLAALAEHGKDLEVRVANYGSDYSSAETLKDYDPVVVHVQMPPDDGGDREVLSKQALIGLICLGVLVVLLAFVAAFFFVCFKKEREAHYGLLRINANQDGMVL